MDYMAQNGGATDGHKLVKWSPPYRGGRVDDPVFDLVDLEKDGPGGPHRRASRTGVSCGPARTRWRAGHRRSSATSSASVCWGFQAT
jgi:hypothetical protein